MTEFVDAYSKSTGRKHRVPAYFFDNPALSKDLRKTPPPEKKTSGGSTRTSATTRAADETPATGDDKE
ncbi:hypothetical protein [Nocardioides pakistanensis]